MLVTTTPAVRMNDNDRTQSGHSTATTEPNRFAPEPGHRSRFRGVGSVPNPLPKQHPKRRLGPEAGAGAPNEAGGVCRWIHGHSCEITYSVGRLVGPVSAATNRHSAFHSLLRSPPPRISSAFDPTTVLYYYTYSLPSSLVHSPAVYQSFALRRRHLVPTWFPSRWSTLVFLWRCLPA